MLLPGCLTTAKGGDRIGARLVALDFHPAFEWRPLVPDTGRVYRHTPAEVRPAGDASLERVGLLQNSYRHYATIGTVEVMKLWLFSSTRRSAFPYRCLFLLLLFVVVFHEYHTSLCMGQVHDEHPNLRRKPHVL